MGGAREILKGSSGPEIRSESAGKKVMPIATGAETLLCASGEVAV